MRRCWKRSKPSSSGNSKSWVGWTLMNCWLTPRSFGRKRGLAVGNIKVGKGMKLEVVTDASGLPLGIGVDAANVCEQELLVPALRDVPVDIPPGTPLIADKGHDSDRLRDELEAEGMIPVIPHRKDRVRPSRNDGRRLRRYGRRWKSRAHECVAALLSGLGSAMVAYVFMYLGMVYLAFIHMALQRF